jgi:AAA domain
MISEGERKFLSCFGTAGPVAKPPPAAGIDIVFAEDIELDLLEAGLVEGLLTAGAMSVVYGDSNVGKSFWAIDLACHVGAGLRWRDLEVTPGVVIYIAAENPKSVERRIWAWCQTHRPDKCQVAVVRSNVDLRDPKATTPRLLEKIRRIRQERGQVVLIVVDTLSRAMAGANENSPEDMTAFVGNCDHLRSTTGAHAMIIHHSGKEAARGSRGHSSLRAATDTEIEVAPGRATVTKQRDAETMGSYGFRLVPFELGQNARGRTVTTCVVEPCEVAADAPKEEKRRKLGPNEKIVFDALKKALVEVGEMSEGPSPAAGVKFVTHEQLRVRAARLMPQGELKRNDLLPLDPAPAMRVPGCS